MDKKEERIQEMLNHLKGIKSPLVKEAKTIIKSLRNPDVAEKLGFTETSSYGGEYFPYIEWCKSSLGAVGWSELEVAIRKKLNLFAGNYTVTKLTAENIRVGCQTVTYEQIRKIYLAMQKLRRTNSNEKSN